MSTTRAARYLIANAFLWCGVYLIPDEAVRRDFLKLLRIYDEGRTSPERANAILRLASER